MKKSFLLAFISLCLLLPAASWAASQPDMIDLERSLKRIFKDNPDLVLDVLRQNSEAVLDIAQQGSNLRRKHNLEAQWREDLKKHKEVELAGRPVLGNKNAKVKIIAFSDFTCHYCGQASKTIEEILKEYGDDVGFVFKHLPLDEKGPGGQASAYFIAIAKQDEAKAWDFYRAMYADREKLLSEGEAFLKSTAQNLGVDMKKLQKDIHSKQVSELMGKDLADGQKLGVEGTPYFLVNDLVIRGALPLELFKNAVDMAKSEAK